LTSSIRSITAPRTAIRTIMGRLGRSMGQARGETVMTDAGGPPAEKPAASENSTLTLGISTMRAICIRHGATGQPDSSASKTRTWKRSSVSPTSASHRRPSSSKSECRKRPAALAGPAAPHWGWSGRRITVTRRVLRASIAGHDLQRLALPLLGRSVRTDPDQWALCRRLYPGNFADGVLGSSWPS
jgi:hypothetical protein